MLFEKGSDYMETFKILHTADMHLGSRLLNMGDKSDKRRAELNETFSSIIDLALSENVDALLIAGDMFEDSNPSAELLDFVSNQFKRLGQTKVFIVLGNHDWNVKADFGPNVYVFSDYIEKVSVKNADIYGVSFADEHCSVAVSEGFVAEDADRINILLMHGEVAGKSVYNPIDENQLQNSGIDYAALGHVHAHGGFVKLGNFTYSYCGIPEGRAFDETGAKGVVIAEISKGEVNGRFVNICRREYVLAKVDVTGEQDNFSIACKVAKELASKDNAYRITLCGERGTFIDTTFIKEFLEKDFYFTEIVDETVQPEDNSYTLKGIFSQKCDNPGALKYGLLALRGEKVHIE